MQAKLSQSPPATHRGTGTLNEACSNGFGVRILAGHSQQTAWGCIHCALRALLRAIAPNMEQFRSLTTLS